MLVNVHVRVILQGIIDSSDVSQVVVVICLEILFLIYSFFFFFFFLFLFFFFFQTFNVDSRTRVKDLENKIGEKLKLSCLDGYSLFIQVFTKS